MPRWPSLAKVDESFLAPSAPALSTRPPNSQRATTGQVEIPAFVRKAASAMRPSPTEPARDRPKALTRIYENRELRAFFDSENRTVAGRVAILAPSLTLGSSSLRPHPGAQSEGSAWKPSWLSPRDGTHLIGPWTANRLVANAREKGMIEDNPSDTGDGKAVLDAITQLAQFGDADAQETIQGCVAAHLQGRPAWPGWKQADLTRSSGSLANLFPALTASQEPKILLAFRFFPRTVVSANATEGWLSPV